VGAANKNDPSGIFVRQVRGGAAVRLTHGDDIHPAWSPDDRYIAFWRNGEGAMRLIPSIGGPERKIAQLGYPSRILWTPDGKWLIISLTNSPNEPRGIWLLSVETGERRRLLPPPAVVIHPREEDSGDFAEALSEGGRVLGFRRHTHFGSQLYTVRLASDYSPAETPQLLTARTYPSFWGIAWVNARDIVYSAGGSLSNVRLWRIRSGVGRPELLQWSASGSTRPAVSPAQHLLAYTTTSYSGKFWRTDLHTGERRMLMDSKYQDWHPVYSPDGRKFAFQTDRSGAWELWACDSDGTNCQQLTFFEGPVSGTPYWSPDGRWIVLDSRAEGTSQIYVIPSDGGKPRRITSGAAQNQVPSWSRDGKWIYFESDRSGQWRIWKTSIDGGSTVQVTRNSGGAAYESADGRYLYFASTVTGSGPVRLFRMPVGGGSEVEVAPKLVNWHSLSITKRGVYLLSDPTTLQLLEASTGKIRTVARAKDYSFGECIAVSPDDTSVIFAELEWSGSNLMLVENFR